MTSITRKLHFRLIRRKLGIYVFMDLLLFLLAWAAFIIGIEFRQFSVIESMGTYDRSRTVLRVPGSCGILCRTRQESSCCGWM